MPAVIFFASIDFGKKLLFWDSLLFEKDLKIFPNDIVVIPEDHNAALEAFGKVAVKKYVFCQNHFYIFKGLKDYTHGIILAYQAFFLVPAWNYSYPHMT